MITLNLLHPIEATPIQTWKFESEPVIRIGRSGDNDVILYSSVVSRYHVEIHRHPLHWEIVNIGANGTYINDQPIEKERVQDGITIRLAATGPKLQILLDGAGSPTPLQQIAATQPVTSKKPSDNRPTFMPRK
ncbi:FHA domain-containing protein [Pseudanabaena yagii]|uniref:FHA domain-containing protein n=1 Tax=Pseudanabaena yagii GIHE-NHR1 TaxID=2722753 RepID=A0ABX1LN38_9CYAN|nr:FHA domain-containing protein [Pseudanabaena yagii]NMF57548.1 FHA domain-containing protein [Pseudanabaena yagii GIHE-NHR1]